MGGGAFKGRVHTEETKAVLREKALIRAADKPKAVRRSYYVPVSPEQRRKTGPKPGTPRHERRALTDDQVRSIRKMKADGASYSALEAHFGLDRAPLFRIVTRKTYADIPD